MPIIVGVHGTEKELDDETTLHEEWYPALCAGLRRAGVVPPKPDAFCCAFYGDLFHPNRVGAAGERHDHPRDVASERARKVLARWRAAATGLSGLPGASDNSPVPMSVQRALFGLSHSRFLAGMVERTAFGGMQQVRAYLRHPAVRSAAQARLAQTITSDTRVLVAHSLGSVVAYECLCAHPEWPVTTLVTIGSPLGIPNLIFHQLQPAPRDGRGAWPGSVLRWINLCHLGDGVALVKALAPLFDDRVEDRLISNRKHAHSVTTYLAAEETGRAVAAGLN
jgi:hypothetical protein